MHNSKEFSWKMGEFLRKWTRFRHNRLTNFHDGLRLWLNRLEITAKTANRFNLPTLIRRLNLSIRNGYISNRLEDLLLTFS